VALLFSVASHLIAAALFLGLSALTAGDKLPAQKVRPVTLRALDDRSWAANRGQASLPQALARAVAEPRPRGQVVDVAPGNGQVDPASKYLAETSNRVSKETRAREQTAVYRQAAPKNVAPLAPPVARGQAAGYTAPPVAAAGQVDKFTGLGGSRSRLSQLLREASVGRDEVNPEAEAKGGQQSGEGNSGEPSGGAPNDDLSGVAAGDGTFLNTREWKYAGFFNRVKQAVSARWDPNGRLRSKDPRGRGFGAIDRVTLLNVALRPDGTIYEIVVAQSSGLDYLDAESVKAFETAQPFANPPPALIQDGLIRFAFGFTVVNEGLAGSKWFRPGG
jgi:TonB family protein